MIIVDFRGITFYWFIQPLFLLEHLMRSEMMSRQNKEQSQNPSSKSAVEAQLNHNLWNYNWGQCLTTYNPILKEHNAFLRRKKEKISASTNTDTSGSVAQIRSKQNNNKNNTIPAHNVFTKFNHAITPMVLKVWGEAH